MNTNKLFGVLFVFAICSLVLTSGGRRNLNKAQLPFLEGTLAGPIVFSDGSSAGQIGEGCKVQLYDRFVIVSQFPPGKPNTTALVFRLDQIDTIPLKKLP